MAEVLLRVVVIGLCSVLICGDIFGSGNTFSHKFNLFNRNFANLETDNHYYQPYRDELLPNRQIRRPQPIKRCGIVFKKYLKAHCNNCLKDPEMAPISKRAGYGRDGPGIGTICCVMGCYDEDLDIYCCVDPKTPKI